MSAVLVIGISGGSGSGKTTFARMLQANLGDHFCGWISQDSYYRDRQDLTVSERAKINYDHPDSIEFSLLAQHLRKLKAGEDVVIPSYDFATHSRGENSVYFTWRPVILVDGILLMTQSELRELFDYSFFVDTQEDLRFRRRLERDVRERGRTAESVRDQFFNHVKPMHDLFVEPSRLFADRIISGEKSFGPIIEQAVFGLNRPDQLAIAD